MPPTRPPVAPSKTMEQSIAKSAPRRHRRPPSSRSKNSSKSTSVQRNTSEESLSSATAVASESLQQMVHEMESQLQNVLASPVFQDAAIKASGTEEEQADAFIENCKSPSVEEESEEVFARTLDVPKWLSDETVAEHLLESIKKQKLESEYKCTIELSGRGTTQNSGNNNSTNHSHLIITMKGQDTRQLGRARRSLEDSLIAYLKKVTPKSAYRSNEKSRQHPPPPALGRLLYTFALSATDNSPRWRDRNRHRTVLGRAVLPLFTNNKVWMNVVELPKDEEGNFHGMFLAGKGGRLFEFYRERYQCRVDIFGYFGQKGDNEAKNASDGDRNGDEVVEDQGIPKALCDPYVLVTSKEGKQNVDNCLQFIEHRIRDHQEQWGVSRDRDAEQVGIKRRMKRPAGARGRSSGSKQNED